MGSIRFKQIVEVAGKMYGLDRYGRVWQRDDIGWIPVEMAVDEHFANHIPKDCESEESGLYFPSFCAVGAGVGCVLLGWLIAFIT